MVKGKVESGRKNGRGTSKKALIVTVPLFLFVLLGAGYASASTHYVDPGETIRAAVDGASAGDTIIVRDGTYYENIEVDKRLTNSNNIWNTLYKMTYAYNNSTYTNYVGNHWDDYERTDADGDGTGNRPYNINGDSDNYPLMKLLENYFA